MIKSLRIRNFKSFDDVTFEFTPLTALIGANAAGKSNLFHAIRFLRDALLFDIETAFANQGGVEEVRPRSSRLSPPLSFRLEAEPMRGAFEETAIEVPVSNPTVSFTLTVDYGTNGKPKVLEETFHSSASVESGREMTHSLPPSFRTYMERTAFFSFDPASIRNAPSSLAASELEPRGQNLPAVLHWVENEPRLKARFVEAMGFVIPGIRDFTTRTTPDGGIGVEILEKGVSGATSLRSVSDGTLLWMCYQALPILARETGMTLIAIEEPENGLHPRLMDDLADILREITETTQVIISTHNPYLLDCLKPEEVSILEKEDGRTHVLRAQNNGELEESLKWFSLGEIWFQGRMGGIASE